MPAEDTFGRNRSPEAEEALSEFLQRRDAGEPLDFDAYCAQRPEIAEALRLLYSIHWQREKNGVVADETMSVASELLQRDDGTRYDPDDERGKSGNHAVQRPWPPHDQRPVPGHRGIVGNRQRPF